MSLAMRLFVLALPLTLAAGVAQATEVQRSIAVEAPPAEVWEAVGSFCSIGEWHPDVVSCTLEEDDLTSYRTVESTDGSIFKEQLLELQDEVFLYSYSLVDSPLPVTGLVGELQVIPGPDGTSSIVWQAQFSTLGADEDAAADQLGDFYVAGLEGIARRFDEGAS